MSETSSKSFIVKAGILKGVQQILSFTPKRHIRLNATRLNPRRNEEGQPVTLSLSDVYDYIYMITDQVKVGDDKLDVIKGFTFKPWDGEAVTAYIKGEKPPVEEAHEG